MFWDQSLRHKGAAKMQSATAAGDSRVWRKEMQIFGRAAQKGEKKAVCGLEPPGCRRQQLMEMHINRELPAATWEWGWQELTPWINTARRWMGTSSCLAGRRKENCISTSQPCSGEGVRDRRKRRENLPKLGANSLERVVGPFPAHRKPSRDGSVPRSRWKAGIGSQRKVLLARVPKWLFRVREGSRLRS